ncbi:cytochrome P450 71A1-like [Morus notabilis]|uniref:cytochrome P450 71A1-like n=1 Tax=Morus notabilis TaxID=981085 RepID=UPI000CED3C22|nr:cytochrome P450 71A1-like [Morus notabilis]
MIAFSVGDFFRRWRWIDVVRGFISSLKSTSRALDDFYTQVIEEHNCKAINTRTSSDDSYNGYDSEDFMDVLLKLQKDPSKIELELTPDHVKVRDMLLARVDTSSTLMEWLMAELLRNPKVMKKVQEEVRSVVGEKAKIEMDDTNHMSYLKRVIKETLSLLYWFYWKLATGLEDQLPEDLDMSEVYGLTVHKKVPLQVLPIAYSP